MNFIAVRVEVMPSPAVINTLNQGHYQMNLNWFAFAAATMLAASALADDRRSGGVTPNLDKGTKVLEAAAAINVMGDNTYIQLAYGQFVADGIEVALVAGLSDDDIFMSTELGLRAEYSPFLDSPLVPFLGVGAVWADTEADDSNINTDAAVFSVGGGVKYFISDDVALAVNGNYLAATDDVFVDSEDGEVQGDELRIHFSVRFSYD